MKPIFQARMTLSLFLNSNLLEGVAQQVPSGMQMLDLLRKT